MSTRTPVFIDEYAMIYLGEDAAARLAERGTVPLDGVARVEMGRWEEAQRYERRTWLQRNLHASSDRNEDHRKKFFDYVALRGRRFQRGIELGCGPFTNMRYILTACRVEEVHLLDPLVMDYLKHPACRYRHSRLGGLFKELPSLSSLRRPHHFFRDQLNRLQVGRLLGRAVCIHPSTIEAFRPLVSFDLVVMINVIEHCQDAEKVFAKILEILSPGGMLVYADTVYEPHELGVMSALYDAGHPLRVSAVVVERFLSRFESVFVADFTEPASVSTLKLRNRCRYFIGTRHAS